MRRNLFKGSSKILVMFKYEPRDFPGGLVVQILPSNAGGVGLIPGQGAMMYMPCGQKTRIWTIERKLEQIQ